MMKPYLLLPLLGMAAGASFGTLSKKMEENFARHGVCTPGSVLEFLTSTGSPECNAFHNMNHYLQRYNENIQDAAVETSSFTFQAFDKTLEEYEVSGDSIKSPDLKNGDFIEAVVTSVLPRVNVSVVIHEIGDKDMYGCPKENIRIPVNATNTVLLGQRSKLSCLESKLYEVLEVMGKYKCFEGTRTLEGNIRIEHSYKNISATTFTEEIDETSILYFLDYASPDALAAYKITCEEFGGEYSEISFDADCKEKDANDVVLYDESMKVVKFPRCYGQQCNRALDEQWLLEDFTMRTTEERNQKAYGNIWTCTGKISSVSDVIGMSEEMCHKEIAAIGADQDVAVNKAHVATSFSAKNILNNNVAVQFTESDGYQRACERLGGVFAMATVDVTCVLKRQDSFVGLTNYVSTSYPICTGRSCDSSDLALNFQEHVFAVESAKSNDAFELDCSGGLRLGLGVLASFVGVGMFLLA